MRVEQFLERSARRDPRNIALVCAGQRCSYRDIDERADQFARRLLAGGLQSGDRVAICLENSVDTVVSLFGVLKAGGIFFIVNPQTRAGQLSELLSDSGAAALVSREGKDTRLQFLAAAGNGLTPASALGGDADIAALVYTSGSTGRPKGVMLTHRNMTAAADAIGMYLENTSDDVILNVLPLAFTYGLGQVTTAFSVGATLVLERSFAYPQAVIETMLRERVTGFPLVPTIATLLLQQDPGKHAFPHLRYITNAAAALSIAKIERLRHAFPRARIFSMYGLTECQRVSYLPPGLIDTRPASVGVAIPGTEVCIVDERGRQVPSGTTGELVVRGPHVMKGYWHQPEETTKVLGPAAFSAEPVLHTGDLFRMDRDGLLYFVCRKDDLIKTRGEKVAPRQVEEVIARIRGVAEVAVYGIPDDLLGEAVAAVITLAAGAALRREQVQRYCLEHLDAFMVPKVVEIRDAIPTTLTGKISRRELRLLATPEEKRPSEIPQERVPA